MLDTLAMPHAVASAMAAPGRGSVRVVRSGNRSVADRVYATSPLRLLTPANHGRAAWIFMSSYGGGFVDGDSVVIHAEVGPGAAAFISTQSSTKVYRSPHGTVAEMHASVGAEALLVVAPDPIVCFAGARYRQVQQYDVAESGALVVVDWLTSGRHTRGERWAFASYEARLSVRQQGIEIIHDAVALRDVDGDLSRRMHRFNVLALVTIIGTPVGVDAAAAIRDTAVEPVSTRADQLVAATALPGGGCVVRIAGVSFEQVSRTVRQLLAFVPERIGDSPWDRKW